MEFEHLLSYRERQSLPLSDLGLVLIRGRNEVSEAADSNGVGKTAIMDILSFGWFGVTLRGKRGEEVANRFTKAPGRVLIPVEDDLGKWFVMRQTRPKKLEVAGIPGLTGAEDDRVLQEKIEARLGWGLRTFRNAMVFGQGTFDRFAQADQDDQLRMLDEIQGLDLRDALDRAKQWRDTLERAYCDAGDALQGMEQEGVAHQQHLVSLEEARKGFDRMRADRVARLKEQGDTQREEVRRLAAELGALVKRRRDVEQKRVLWGTIQKAQQEVDLLKPRVLQAETSERHLLEEAKTRAGALQDLLSAGACPTCRRPIEGDQTRIRQAFDRELRAARTSAQQAVDQTTKLREALVRATQALNAIVIKLPTPLSERILGQEEALVSLQVEKRLETEQRGALETLARIQKELEEERGRQWEGESSLATLRSTLRTLASQITETQEIRLRTERTLRVADYWVEAFGDRGIRSLLFDSAAMFLTTRVATHLEILAGGEAQAPISATRALKKGGTRERVTIAPVWAWGGAGLDVGSAGQDRRVDLALFAALQDLAESQSARPFPLKVWDEPGDALDERGKELFCRWVEQEARQRGTGLLITHSTDIVTQIRPDEIWTVVLDEHGSRVERSRS